MFPILALTLASCATPERELPPVSVDIPPELSLFRQSKNDLLQYRGSDGELWTFVVTRRVLGENPAPAELIGQKEAEYRANAPRFPNPRLEKKPMAGNGTLLTFAYQTTRDGRLYSYVDFAGVWSDGLRVMGSVEWPNLLEPWHDAVVERLAGMRPRN